jgi:uncharacterized protein YeaO (DUF488 family)
MTNKSEVRMRRVYDEPTRQDGIRVLVDRCWRGRHASMIMLVTEDHPRWIRSRMMAGLDAAIR